MPLARLDGISINYKVEGHGEPLVMIMGFGASRSGWFPQIRFFKRYYRVITFDNRGTGKSDKPPGPYSTGMMADDTVKLLRAGFQLSAQSDEVGTDFYLCPAGG